MSLLAAIALGWLGLITLFGVGRMIAVSPGMAMPSMRWGASPGLLLFCRLPVAGHSAASGASMIGGMGPLRGVMMWLVMVVTMMLPTTLPAVRHVGHNTLRWRRRRAVASFVGAYLAIWMIFGVVVLLAASLISPINSRAVLLAALLLAAVWQFMPQKHRALAACHRSVPLPPTGRAATRGVLRFARINGLACLRSCWAMMLAMAMTSSGALVMMLALAGAAAAEKRTQRPRRAARIVGASLGGACALLALISF